MADFVKVADMQELAPGEMKAVDLGGEEIVLANVEGRVYAFGGSCTHRGGPLADGSLVGEEVICPLHGGSFNVRTGEVTTAPPRQSIPTYEVKVEGSEVKVARP